MDKHSQGFSTMELLTVLLILSIIAAIATQSIGFVLSKARTKATILELVADIRYAQQLAVGERINCHIVFYNSNKFYIIRVDGIPLPKTIKLVNFDKGIDISTNFPENRFYFTSLGAPSTGGTIYVKDSGGRTYRITILPATGRIRVYD